MRRISTNKFFDMRYGTTRNVFLIGGLAVKLPSFCEWRLFLLGLLANMQERKFSATRWPELCPVVFSIPGGFIVVMRRAQPLTRKEFDAIDLEAWANKDEYRIPIEYKMDSVGWLDYNLVAIDYGN